MTKWPSRLSMYFSTPQILSCFFIYLSVPQLDFLGRDSKGLVIQQIYSSSSILFHNQLLTLLSRTWYEQDWRGLEKGLIGAKYTKYANWY